MYQEQCRTHSDIVAHLPRFVDLVRLLKATHVLELGTRTGVSTIAWLYALDGRGTLTSVDIDTRPPIGEWDHWEFIQGDDMDPDLFASLQPADIVFIDTSHHYRHTLTELNLYRWLVKPGGVMVCHDTELPVPEGAPPSDPRFPVRTAIDEFCTANGFSCEFVPGCWGLGIIRL
jgi:predicted O-methyltransferase YrrM